VQHSSSSPAAIQLSSSNEEDNGAEKPRAMDENENDDDDDGLDLPVRRRRFVGSSQAVPSPQDDGSASSDDDLPLVTPSSIARRARKRAFVPDDSGDDQGDAVRPQPASSPVKRRRLIPRKESSPATVGNASASDPAPQSSAVQRKTPRRPRTEKAKAWELLRRKRAGEVIVEEPEPSEEEEEPVKAIYDTDSDNPALARFLDEEEDEEDEEGPPQKTKPVPAIARRSPSKRKDKKKMVALDSDSSASGSESDGGGPDERGSASGESIDDFVVEDDDGLIGVPEEALLDIPLQFTAHSHKRIKDHFRDALEWLVQHRINPGFEKHHELYRIAWQKLDDEVSGLAHSKFVSSAWKSDFYMALRARPEFTNEELGDTIDTLQNCGACGRANHPAK
jgi:hypothetical protein